MFLNLKCWQVLQRRPRHIRTCRDQTCYFGGGEGAGGWSTWWRFWGPSHADTPPGDLKSKGGRAPEGKKRPGEDGGGRVGHHHLFLEEDHISGWRESTSKALVEQAGGDWPSDWSSCSSRTPFTCPQSWENSCQPKESWPAKQIAGESFAEAWAFQDWLIHSIMKKT